MVLVYLPTKLGHKNGVNVGKYSIHWAYGSWIILDAPQFRTMWRLIDLWHVGRPLWGTAGAITTEPGAIIPLGTWKWKICLESMAFYGHFYGESDESDRKSMGSWDKPTSKLLRNSELTGVEFLADGLWQSPTCSSTCQQTVVGTAQLWFNKSEIGDLLHIPGFYHWFTASNRSKGYSYPKKTCWFSMPSCSVYTWSAIIYKPCFLDISWPPQDYLYLIYQHGLSI
jgi:hypothetical protein